MKYDVIVPVAGKDVAFVPRVIKHLRKFLEDVEIIYVITNKNFFRYLSKHINLEDRVKLLDENELVPNLSFATVKNILRDKGTNISVGWFFQQFLKLGFATTKYANKYYLSWDSDTLLLRQIDFFHNNHPLFTVKYEHNYNYFVTISRIFGLNKNNDYSYIAEHMMFNSDIVKEIISEILSSRVNGNFWFEKIINAGDFSINPQTFSEFETYGTFVSSKYPKLYETRRLNTFRFGGYIQGRSINDRKLERMSFDVDTMSFENDHSPLFPYNIIEKTRNYLFRIFVIKEITFLKFIHKLLHIIKKNISK